MRLLISTMKLRLLLSVYGKNRKKRYLCRIESAHRVWWWCVWASSFRLRSSIEFYLRDTEQSWDGLNSTLGHLTHRGVIIGQIRVWNNCAEFSTAGFNQKPWGIVLVLRRILQLFSSLCNLFSQNWCLSGTTGLRLDWETVLRLWIKSRATANLKGSSGETVRGG